MAELILVGDRVLIQPDDSEEQRESGLVLPASVKEKEKVQSGYVVRVGPGYLTQNPDYTGEPWSQSQEAVRYLPLQAEPATMPSSSARRPWKSPIEGRSTSSSSTQRSSRSSASIQRTCWTTLAI